MLASALHPSCDCVSYCGDPWGGEGGAGYCSVLVFYPLHTTNHTHRYANDNLCPTGRVAGTCLNLVLLLYAIQLVWHSPPMIIVGPATRCDSIIHSPNSIFSRGFDTKLYSSNSRFSREVLILYSSIGSVELSVLYSRVGSIEVSILNAGS